MQKIKNLKSQSSAEQGRSISNLKSRKRGFSMTEVLITVSLFLLLAGAGLGAYFQYYVSSLISTDIDNVLTFVKNTRFKALKNATNSDYGIHIDSDSRALISFNVNYVPNNPENEILQLDQLEIIDLSLDPSPGVTNEILFQKQTGKTENTGSFTVGENSFSYIFTINTQGVVN
jgi:prepilin-type N-terminal cleavage/methylation domain-containing protein